MGHNEHRTTALAPVAFATGSTPSPQPLVAPIDPLSVRAGGRRGVAVLRRRGLADADAQIDAACRQLARATDRPDYVALDAGRDHLGAHGAAESLLHHVLMAGYSATSLVVQVPLEAIAVPAPSTAENLRRFRAAGARLYLGGLSGRRHLSLLDHFPIDGVVLAASVTSPQNGADLLPAILHAARSRGLETMAVDATSARARRRLADLGVDHARRAIAPT